MMHSWIKREREKWESYLMETMSTMWLGRRRSRTKTKTKTKTNQTQETQTSQSNHMENQVSLELSLRVPVHYKEVLTLG